MLCSTWRHTRVLMQHNNATFWLENVDALMVISYFNLPISSLPLCLCSCWAFLACTSWRWQMHAVPAALPSDLPSCTPSSWALTFSSSLDFFQSSNLAPLATLNPSCLPLLIASFSPFTHPSIRCPQFHFSTNLSWHLILDLLTAFLLCAHRHTKSHRCIKTLKKVGLCFPTSCHLHTLSFFYPSRAAASVAQQSPNDQNTDAQKTQQQRCTTKQIAASLCRDTAWQMYFPLYPLILLPSSFCLIFPTNSHSHLHPPLLRGSAGTVASVRPTLLMDISCCRASLDQTAQLWVCSAKLLSWSHTHAVLFPKVS